MKRIGIVTIRGGGNYGNKLQMYAVQQTLRRLGCITEVLRRNPESRQGSLTEKVEQRVCKVSPCYLRDVLHSRLHYRFDAKNGCDGRIDTALRNTIYRKHVQAAKRKRQAALNAFDQSFIQESDFSISRDSIPHEALSRYDCFVCGSDQVWNPTYPQTSLIDFLDFAPEEKRVAYAPSFGVGSIPEPLREQYTEWLNGIPHLSVRERRGAEIIRELTGRDAIVLTDPTMMLTADEWLHIARKPVIPIPKRYLLTYFLGDETREYGRFISNIAKQHGMSIINLFNIRELEHYTIDPCGFIWLIAHAALICTDSFHGTVFSILLQRDFIAFDRVESGSSMGSRQETLLQLFKLEARSYRKVRTDEKPLGVDFSSAEEVLRHERERTYAFLRKALGEAPRQN